MNTKQTFFRTLIAVQSLVLLLFVFGCTSSKKQDFLPTPTDVTATQIWSKFRNKQSYLLNREKGFRIKGSMNVSTPKENSRMTFTFWGNYSHPLRIDMQAGFGTTFALWRISRNKWEAYFPGRETVYTHSDPALGTARLGFPIPFNFKHLAFILNGYWREIIPENYSNANYLTDRKCWEFYFQSDQVIHSLKLDKNAYPMEISGNVPYNWTVSLKEYFPNKDKAIPRRLVLDINRKYESIITIKDIKSRNKKWTDQSLGLKLPENTDTVPLQQNHR